MKNCFVNPLTLGTGDVLNLADRTIALKNGKLEDIGPPQIAPKREEVQSALDSHSSEENDAIESPKIAFSNSNKAQAIPASDDRRRQQGDLSVYKFYFANSGYAFLIGNMLFVVAWMFLTEFSTIWLKWWSEDNAAIPNEHVGFYMGIYAMFGILGTLCACISGWLILIRMVSQSAERLHLHLLQAVLKAPFWLLASTDTGDLLNRFSQDMELIDMNLPAMVSSYITTATQCLVKVVILLVFSKYLGAAVPLLGAAVYFLQKFYLRTSRQVRLLGIEAKAPLYSFFTDTVDGAVTLRAFGWQSSYQDRLCKLNDTFQRPEYLQSCIQHWLTFVLDMIVAVLAVVLVATIVTWRDEFDAGSVGVSMVMIIGFSTSLMRVIKSWTAMESSIGAVARIKQFVDETEQEEMTDGLDRQWLLHGSLQIRDLDASHR